MTCSVRETKGEHFGKCLMTKVGEDTSGDVFWCKDCGIIVGVGEPLTIEIPMYGKQLEG